LQQEAGWGRGARSCVVGEKDPSHSEVVPYTAAGNPRPGRLISGDL
jgi:hypothetical protein